MPGARPDLRPSATARPGPLGRPGDARLSAIVVLGCRVHLDGSGRLSAGALLRRVTRGAQTYFERGDSETLFVVTGGRRWGDVVEADAMARELVICGVPERAIIRERCSLSTRDNARFTAAVLSRRGIEHAALVTCPWHMARAVTFFSRTGLDVEAVATTGGQKAHWPSLLWRWGVERVLEQV